MARKRKGERMQERDTMMRQVKDIIECTQVLEIDIKIVRMLEIENKRRERKQQKGRGGGGGKDMKKRKCQ